MLLPGRPAPGGLTTPGFRAVPLTAAVAELDYACYLASPEVIRIHSGGHWPVTGFTLEQDLEQVAVHEAEQAAGVSFAFVLLHPERDEALGCLYLLPLQRYLDQAGADEATKSAFPARTAIVTFWIRQDLQLTSLPWLVAAGAHAWIMADWPVAAHLFRIRPGEDTSRAALERLGLRRVSLPLAGEHRDYRWYRQV